MKNREPAFKHPPVHTTESRVLQVSPSDILRSEAGQKLIREVATSPHLKGVVKGDGAGRGKS